MTTGLPPKDGTAASDLAGRTLGGYRLIRHLGSGGMADVYLAEQTSLGRRVAVKVLRPETLRHPGAVERFEREARAAAALVHGNIVQIHEVARIEGVHFLVTEFVEGPSLKEWLTARGPLDAPQALDVLEQVGSALARAADQGIVHRDIKPENLLVTRAGEVKVADFGLARVATDDVTLTQTGMTLGTPLYMSPEQGRGDDVDARSDLYSLGATLYHLLAGTPPFSGATSVSVAMAHGSEPLVPLARRRADLPASLCSIVERLLSKAPADRFQHPRTLLEAVGLARSAIAPGPRHPAPLTWQATGAWPSASAASQPSSAPDVIEATRLLAASLANEESDRATRRRRWLITLVAASIAAAAGFALGRGRTRRLDGFPGFR